MGREGSGGGSSQVFSLFLQSRALSNPERKKEPSSLSLDLSLPPFSPTRPSERANERSFMTKNDRRSVGRSPAWLTHPQLHDPRGPFARLLERHKSSFLVLSHRWLRSRAPRTLDQSDRSVRVRWAGLSRIPDQSHRGVLAHWYFLSIGLVISGKKEMSAVG